MFVCYWLRTAWEGLSQPGPVPKVCFWAGIAVVVNQGHISPESRKVDMKYRKKVSRRRSKKRFTRSARFVHPKNVVAPRRGGFRI